MAGVAVVSKKTRKILKVRKPKAGRKKNGPPEIDAPFRYKDVHIVVFGFPGRKLNLDAQRKELEGLLKGRYHYGLTKIPIIDWDVNSDGDATRPVLKKVQKIYDQFAHQENLLIFLYNGHATIKDEASLHI